MKKFLTKTLLTGALLVPLALGAQNQTPPTPDESGAGTNYQSRRQQWKAMKQQLRAEIQAEDQQLQQLVTDMNNAQPEQKTDAIAAVVNQLVQDRLAMHQRMESMHQQMQGANAPPSGETNTAPSP